MTMNDQPASEAATRRALLGLALLLMLLALPPGQALRFATPAAYGHSGAFEIFLFLSGMLLAPPLTRVFQEAGAIAGLTRAAHRVWQIYWRYLGAVLISALIAIAVLGAPSAEALAPIGLAGIATDPAAALLSLTVLSAQPGFFAALPCYLMVLALSPLLIGLARVVPWAAPAASLALYVASQFAPIAPEAWRYDPLAWQLVFYVGFALGAGWISVSLTNRTLFWAAAAVLAASAATAPDGAIGGLWRGDAAWLEAERGFGPARAVHFAALAFLAAIVAPSIHTRLAQAAPWMTRRLERIGAQALVGLVALHPIAALCGAAAASAGNGFLTIALAGLAGAALLSLAAETALWFESPPWSRPPERASRAA